MSELDQILTPIAGSNPCGEDLEYDSRFQALKDIVEAGTEENPTDWKKVKKQSLELLGDSRSIELLTLLAVSLVVMDGYKGLGDGLRVFSKSIEEFWDTIYPELDMEEPEPDRHEIRLNTIAQIGEKPGKLGDKICYVTKILQAPLSVNNPRATACFWPIWESEVLDKDDSEELSSAMGFIDQMPSDEKQEIAQLITDSIDHLESLSEFLMEKTGNAYNAPFDDSLLPTLKLISKSFGDVASTDTASADVDPSAAIPEENQIAGATVAAAAPLPLPLGTINSRGDVKEALGKIVDYYKKNEPSSPIPYLAKRIKELVDSDFMGIIQNLSEESEDTFRTVLNIQLDEE